jgi:hypothetical protein
VGSIRRRSRGKAKGREFWKSWKVIEATPTELYTVRFESAAYVLHAFQKKSPKGIRTAQSDVEFVSRRLKVANEDYELRYGKRKK